MRALLCGYGNMGKNHFRTLGNSSRITNIDVFDLYADVPKQNKVSNLSSYLEKTRPDFAVVATPTVTHHELAQLILAQNIPTLIEKPIASTVEEAEEIFKLSESRSIKGIIGFVERCNPVVLALKNEIKDSNVLSIAITRVGPFPPRIRDVGVLVDLSVHDIDLVRYLLSGEEIIESRIYTSPKSKCEYEDNAVIAMRLYGGAIAQITTNWLTPFKKRTIEVATDKAYFEANLITQELKEYSNYEKNNSFLVRSCFVPRGEPLVNQLHGFIDYLETGTNPGLASYKDGLEVLRIIDKKRK